ncbi:MAG: prephenate dehydrogenase [Clostridiaceae bacterium]
MKDLNLSITVVGLGLIGGSLAMALRELSPKALYAVDINEETIRDAKARGVIDEGYNNPEIPLKKSDLVIISLYPNDSLKFIKDNVDNFKQGAIVTDTVGIKEKMMMAVSDLERKNFDFIGGHPMAGKEVSSFKNATKDLFVGASYIFTPSEDSKVENIKLLEDIARGIGCSQVVTVDCKKHDEIIAYTSQIAHVIAVAMVENNLFSQSKGFTAGSFRDVTRVANINANLWSELMIENKESLVEQIEVFQENLEKIKTAINNENYEDLKDIFKRSSSKKGGSLT